MRSFDEKDQCPTQVVLRSLNRRNWSGLHLSVNMMFSAAIEGQCAQPCRPSVESVLQNNVLAIPGYRTFGSSDE
jgi:hypothetical protein